MTMNHRILRLVPCLLGSGALALGQTAPAASPLAENEPAAVELSPFVVESTEESGYMANSTLAGTRLNTSLKDVGAAVSVYTEEFLTDIGVQNLEDILTYTTSTEGGGINGNFSGIEGESSDAARADPSSVNRVRALATATRTRDYFPTDIPSDTFNFGTLTVSRGPNAVLAGIGSAGGVIDASMRQATFTDNNNVVFRLGDYDTHREELHFNRVLVRNRLAMRLDLLNERQGFRQDPTYEKDQRIYLAMQARLRDPRPGGVFGRTTLRANFERGDIEGVPPNQLTPITSLQSWFGNANPALDKWSVNGALQQTLNGAGAVVPNNSVVQGFPIFRNWALIYADPTATTAGVGFADADLAAVQGFMGVIPGGAQGPGGYLRGTGDINRARAGYFRSRLTDRGIFDYYDNLMTGAFDFRTQEFDALDVRVEQLLLDGKAGFEVAYNKQNIESTRDFAFGAGDEEIYIDTTRFLSIRSAAYPTGIPNPNFGRPFIISRDVFRDQVNLSDRKAYQATGFFRHDFTKSESRWARMLGRHTLSGLVFSTEIERTNRTYGSTWDPTGALNPLTSIANPPGTFASQVNAWFYLGDSLLGINDLSEARLQPISGARPEFGQTYTLRVYDPVSRSFVTGTSTPLRILSNLRSQLEEVDSEALTLQSQWFSDHLTTLVGWRNDESTALTSIDLPRLPDGNRDESQFALLPASTQTQESWTKSVVLRYPGRLFGELPFDADLRVFWNDSENFNPVGQRRNIYNEELGSPSASTEEIGLSLSLFRGKLDFRFTSYETTIKGDAVAGVPNAYNYQNAMITRMTGAHQAGLNPADYGYIHPTFNTFEDVARAYFEAIPARLRANMGPEKNFNPEFVGTGATFGWDPDNITNLASVSDTVSEGLEFEVIWNPTPSWRIAVNASKNQAVKANAAADELAFANEWIRNVETLYGGALSRGWRNPPTESLPAIAQYRGETVSQIATANAFSGTRSPEIREWRFNLVTRYEFRRGPLKGFSIGGAARWQDKLGIGYPFVRNENNLDVADLANPYYGPAEFNVDASLGYKRKVNLFGIDVDWNIGLNIRNLVADDELIPIKANADGSYGTVRVPPYRMWMLTNGFRF
jgi:hypothetical protein